RDPYTVLGVKPGVSDEELRAVYRRLVQLHHPDHNNGSPESARRFEEVQDAYASIQRLRQSRPVPRKSPNPPPTSPDVEQRLAEIERELLEKARLARERAQRAARQAAASASKPKRPSDEELGYVKTDDSLGKILADARKEFVERLDEAREEPLGHRVADLLDDFGAKLKGNGDDDRESAGDPQNQARKRP
ncbi:MAG: J domain-containing protein, partial [Solirubrobacteraceae bacterium]